MKILDLLEEKDEFVLFENSGTKITNIEFIRNVEKIFNSVKENDIFSSNDFFLINESDSYTFYSLLFALWKNNNRVVFATDRFIKEEHEVFYKYIVNYDDEIKIVKNELYSGLIIENMDLDTVVFSSGSSGIPKGVLHSKENLLQNTLNVKKIVEIEKGSRSVTMLKPYLVSAFSHFLVHWLSCATLCFLEISRVEKIKEMAEKDPCLSLVGSPIHIFLGMKYFNQNSNPKFLFSSGDFISEGAIEQLLKQYQNTIFYKVYGLAEVAGRFFINKIDNKTSKEKMSLMGKNIDGTRYLIENGEIGVQSEYLFGGYIKNGEFIKSEKVFKTGDMIKNDDEGNLILYGRKDREIKVGGNKVSIPFLETQVASIFPNDIIVLISKRHDIFGNLIIMLIKSDANIQKKEIISRLQKVLQKHELPHQYYKIENVPYTQSMKIDRKEILKDIDSFEMIR